MDAYFDDTSMLRRVHREFAVALSGPRALLMQAAHPVAFEGFFAHSGALDEPYERLRRTAAVMDTIAFGTRADADRAARRVRAMHR
ncbi:MAG: oxygenase MpaB family protein, partial [Solirubrobacteraceae bacterium]